MFSKEVWKDYLILNNEFELELEIYFFFLKIDNWKLLNKNFFKVDVEGRNIFLYL